MVLPYVKEEQAGMGIAGAHWPDSAGRDIRSTTRCRNGWTQAGSADWWKDTSVVVF
jgi:hypothetical protein